MRIFFVNIVNFAQNKISAGMIITFFAFSFLIRNILIPFASDDYSYAFIWQTDGIGNIGFGTSNEIKPIESLHDIFISQWNHYITWGGRTVAHTLIQLFVWIGKPLFNVLNTIIFVLLIFLIYWTANGRIHLNNLSRLNIIWILIVICVCAPELIISMLWLTGACNYMWMAVSQLAFVMIYVLAFRDKISLPAIFIVPFGILAGWTNEAGGFGTLFFVTSLVILMKRYGKLQKWAVAGLIAFVIGYALLMFAPGNIARLHYSHSDYHFTFSLFKEHIKWGFLKVLKNNILLYLMITYYFIQRKTATFTKDETMILLFTAAGILVPTIMIFSPEFSVRACYTSTIFLAVASLMSLNLIVAKKLYPKWLTLQNKCVLTGSVLLTMIWLMGIASCIYVDATARKQVIERFEIIAEHKNDDPIVVSKIRPPSRLLEKFLGLRIFTEKAILVGGDLNDDPRWGQNVCFSKYYGIKSISAVREK